jgi:hypothetical protein
VDHLVGGGVLQHLAVEHGLQAHHLAGGDLVAGDHPGAEAAGFVKVFAGRPLRGGHLPVQHRAVVVAAVTGDVVPGVFFLDAAAALANHHGDFGFVVQAVRLGGAHDVLAVGHLRLAQADEDHRRLGHCAAGLAHMLAIVQAHAEDLARDWG